MGDLISVIINAYNEEKYIKKCIDSVIAQDYKNLEIVVINDGSTDNTLNILNSYKDSRIKIISHKNKGLSLSRNDGIDNAKGKYIYFLDADDFIEKDTITYLYNLIIEYDADMTTCEYIDIYNYNIKKRKIKEEIGILSNMEMLKRTLLNYQGVLNKLMKKELFNNIRFPKRIIEDVPVMYKIAIETNLVVYSNQIKYYRLKHKESIMNKRESKVLIDLYDSRMERYYYLKEKYPNLIENDVSTLFLIMDAYVYNDKELYEHISMNELERKFKEIFSPEILKVKMNKKEKIKIILFKRSPLLYRKIFNIYIGIKKIKKKVL